MSERELQVDGLTLDVENRQVTGPKGTYRLTPMECRLLKVFMLHPHQVLSWGFLMKEVWKTDYVDDSRTLYVHVSWLRKKIESDRQRPRYIQTVKGKGYRFGVE